MNLLEGMYLSKFDLNKYFFIQLYTKKKHNKNEQFLYIDNFLKLISGKEHSVPLSESERFYFYNFIGNKIIENDAVIIVKSHISNEFHVSTLKGAYLQLEIIKELLIK